MVSRLFLALVSVWVVAGCSGDPAEKNTQRAAPLTVDQQIATIEQRTDMPDNIKAQTIASLRQQQAAQQAAASAKK